MKTVLRKVLSLVLVITMCTALLSPAGLAAGDSSVDVKDHVSAGGEGSLGVLLENTLDGAGASGGQGTCVTDVTVRDGIAAVELSTVRDAEVVVAVYTEDGTKMLGSGVAFAAAGSETAEVPIEIDAMPDYYTLGAYVLDPVTHEPLCEAYTSGYYTRQFQDFLTSTADDYDPDRVLDLDGDSSTNFLVFSDRTVGAKQSDGVTVIDNGNGTYTIPEAEERFRSMQSGDSLVYLRNDGSSLILAVKSVAVNGSDVTLTEDRDAELTDVFDFVKIDTVSAPDAGTGPQLDGARDISVGGAELRIPLLTEEMQKEASWKNEYGTSLSGRVDLIVSVSLRIYAAKDYKNVKLAAACRLEGSLTGSESVEAVIPMGGVVIPTQVPGVYITLAPSLVVRFAVSLTAELDVSVTAGFEYDSDSGGHIIDSTPRFGGSMRFKGSLYAGLQLELAAVVLDESLIRASVTGAAGVDLTMEPDIRTMLGDVRHECFGCLKGTPTLRITLSASLDFMGLKGDRKPKVSLTPVSAVLTSLRFYYSADHDEFGWGVCPHRSYKVALTVTDPNGSPAADAVVMGTGAAKEVHTDSDGKASFYLPAGEYHLEILLDEFLGSCDFSVEEKPRTLAAQLKKLDMIDSGALGQSVTWKLYENGLLLVEGTGSTYDYKGSSRTVWYSSGLNSKIKTVIVKEGVTRLGNSVFNWVTALEKAVLPNSLEALGDYVFTDTKLSSVNFPAGLKTIGQGAFSTTPLKNAVLPDSLQSLGPHVFSQCWLLESISFPEGLTEIPDYTCWTTGNDALRSVKIPDSVTRIGEYAFTGCNALESIDLPAGLTEIGSYAFNKCGLTSIELPASVHTIGKGAFAQCSGLTWVSLPTSLTRIEDHLFRNCNKLTGVFIPAAVTEIGNGIFTNCALEQFTFPGTVKTIGSELFYGNPLKSVTISEGVTTLGNSLFSYCRELETVYLPSSLTSVGSWLFSNCSSLETINFAGSRAQWAALTADEGGSFKDSMLRYGISLDGGSEEPIPDEPEPETLPETEEVPVEVISPEEPSSEEPNTEESPAAEPTAEQTPEPAEAPAEASLVTGETPEAGAEITPEPESEPEPEITPDPRSEPEPEIAPEPEEPDAEVELLAAFTGTPGSRDGGKLASFRELIPGARYVFAALKNPDAVDLFAPDNLLFIAQAVAGEDGTLAFIYLPREDVSHAIMAYGPEEADEPAVLRGDVNGDGKVNRQDRVYLARYLAGWDSYEASDETADVNGDGRVNRQDRVYLARYLAGWDGY